MKGALVVVLACCHPERDAWVDEQARNTPHHGSELPEISDETYRGVWILPTPERPKVHVFATDEAAERLFAEGAERTSQR